VVRITPGETTGTAVVLRVEGSVSGEAAHTVEQAARDAGAVRPDVALDLSQVTFVDRHGIVALRSLAAEGIQLVNLTRFVAELLSGDRS
jgi:anti-anti-sigma regulatory factor